MLLPGFRSELARNSPLAGMESHGARRIMPILRRATSLIDSVIWAIANAILEVVFSGLWL